MAQPAPDSSSDARDLGVSPTDPLAEPTGGSEDVDKALAASPGEDALTEALGDLDPEAEASLNGASSSSDAGGKRKPHAVLCPYCGHAQAKLASKSPSAAATSSRAGGERCDHCGGLFEPLSRKATQIAMGPWFLRDLRNPFRPGCSFDVIEKLIKAGQVGPTTVMRGPTTRQFWSIARNVPGVAHRLGYCHACGGRLETDTDQGHPDKCPLCDAAFKTPKHRNELGLAYPNRKAADSAQRSLDRQLALLTGKDMADLDKDGQTIEHHTPDPASTQDQTSKDASMSPGVTNPQPADPTDLLGDVLGIDAPPAKRPEDVSALDFAPDPSPTAPTAAAGSPFVHSADTTRRFPAPVPPAYDDEPRAAAPIAPLHPNQLSPVQPAKPWIIYLLVTLNVLVGLGILGYFVLRPAA